MEFKYFKISNGTTFEDLKSQKRELSKQYHPDKVSGNESTMKIVNEEFLFALEMIKRRHKRFKQINELERKALLGIEFLQPEIETKLKNAAKDILTKLAISSAPRRFKRPIMYGLKKLSPIIDNLDLIDATQKAFKIIKPKIK